MGRRVIPRWSDWRSMLAITLIASAVPGASALAQQPRSRQDKSAALTTPPKIDGKRAYGYLEKICEIGPRVAGSEANARQRKLVADHFAKAGGKVTEQPFHADHPLTGRQVDMVNLIGSWHPERLERVVVCAHYDTRPHADQEKDADRFNQPFLGANDGASGVAVLMEIAHHLDKLETPWGVDLVLFDGEELVYGNNPRRGEYFLGSWHFARSYTEQREKGGASRFQYKAAILLDMVGGKDMMIKREPNSLEFAPKLVRDVWAVARQIGARSFSNEIGREVLDDHLPLNDAKIPAIDLIDFDYPHWHKIDDVPRNCSADSLSEVGRVVTAWLALPPRRSSG
jgi:Peptidase family M28